MSDDDPLFAPTAGDWKSRLQLAVDAVRELSRHDEPQAMLLRFIERTRSLLPWDRTLSLSRRGLTAPQYRIASINLGGSGAAMPWRFVDRRPVVAGGLLTRLLYGEEPVIIDDLHGIVAADDPARSYLEAMRTLVAVPQYDAGVGQSMVIHLRRQPRSFPREHLAELVLLNNLLGRATANLARTSELRAAEQALKGQYNAVVELSDTALHQALTFKHRARDLEQVVRDRTRELRNAHLDAIYMLAVASEAKDEDTGRHVRRMERLAAAIAAELGMSAAQSESVGHAAILHDVGKMHVPDHILKKPGPLTSDEREQMQEHTLAGERILASSAFFTAARRVARSHHENWDGSGYPDASAGSEIPIEARIVHLADVYDALSSPRVYKPAWTAKDAAGVVRESRSRMFDPEVERAFRSLFDRGAIEAIDAGRAAS